jgi:hypothetical protein
MAWVGGFVDVGGIGWIAGASGHLAKNGRQNSKLVIVAE